MSSTVSYDFRWDDWLLHKMSGVQNQQMPRRFETLRYFYLFYQQVVYFDTLPGRLPGSFATNDESHAENTSQLCALPDLLVD